MSKIFLDSNICVYAFDRTNSKHREVALDAISQFPVISSQVIIETYNACYKKLKLSKEICDENTLFLCDITQVVELNTIVFKTAVLFQAKYLLSFLDACIVAAAHYAGCAILYSEDMHHGLVVENSMTIINPFV